MGEFELQVLSLGIREGILTREIALKAAGFISGMKRYRRLVWKLGKNLYERILSGNC